MVSKKKVLAIAVVSLIALQGVSAMSAEKELETGTANGLGLQKADDSSSILGFAILLGLATTTLAVRAIKETIGVF